MLTTIFKKIKIILLLFILFVIVLSLKQYSNAGLILRGIDIESGIGDKYYMYYAMEFFEGADAKKAFKNAGYRIIPNYLLGTWTYIEFDNEEVSVEPDKLKKGSYTYTVTYKGKTAQITIDTDCGFEVYVRRLTNSGFGNVYWETFKPFDWNTLELHVGDKLSYDNDMFRRQVVPESSDGNLKRSGKVLLVMKILLN